MAQTSSLLSLLSSFMLASAAAATDCSRWAEFSSINPKLAPLSVPIDQLQDRLNADPSSEGLIFDVELKDKDIWIDILYVPGDAIAISGIRSLFQIGRLAEGDFSRLVLSDDGNGVFALDEATARKIGCQFIWGEEGGQNPIYLIRLFFENLRDFNTGESAVRGFNGSLLGDTTVAMDYHTKVFLPKWMLSAIEM